MHSILISFVDNLMCLEMSSNVVCMIITYSYIQSKNEANFCYKVLLLKLHLPLNEFIRIFIPF